MKKLDVIPRKFELMKQVFCFKSRLLLFSILALQGFAGPTGLSQVPSEKQVATTRIVGTVLSGEGKPVKNAKVRLASADAKIEEIGFTDDRGAFAFSIYNGVNYSLSAESLGQHSDTLVLPQTTRQANTNIQLVLDRPGSFSESSTASKQASIAAMQFADQPSFTIAGVTDFTAVGGHGSDATLRTSETLAIETSNLATDATGAKASVDAAPAQHEEQLRASLVKMPESFEANHRLGEFYLQSGRYPDAIPLLEDAYRIDKANRENKYDLALACKSIGDPAHAKKYVQELMIHEQSADLFRLEGELDESLGDSLAAVREFQEAVRLDPSDQNLFSWGSELLLHRAILQAQQVFEEGAKRYPNSSKMLTGLGTALFSSAAYDQAAQTLCKASDLNPSDQQPYIFLGKVQMAAPNRLECIEPRLQRLQRQQPGSAVANYLYAMALLKGQHGSNAQASPQPEALLKNTIKLDSKYAEAYLQLGVIYASRGSFSEAVAAYVKAIEADPNLSDAYYRLAVAYDRTGQTTKAKEEFTLHDEIAKRQAAEAEHQRKEVKQFIVSLPAQLSHIQTP